MMIPIGRNYKHFLFIGTILRENDNNLVFKDVFQSTIKGDRYIYY